MQKINETVDNVILCYCYFVLFIGDCGLRGRNRGEERLYLSE